MIKYFNKRMKRFAKWLVKTPTTVLAKWLVRIPTMGLKLFFVLFVGLLVYSCNSAPTADADDTSEVRTPVTVTNVSHLPLDEYIELNATSTFMQQNYIKSNLNGYIQKSNIKYGDYVKRGQPLFVLKTKEASAIGNVVNQLDSSFKFSGVNTIRSDASGYVMQVNHQQGDYVQDGEQLAVISDSKSFMFVMNVPYEDNPYVTVGKTVQLILPDNEVLEGTITSSMPVVDSVSQTQSYSIRVNAPHTIPQNLIAKVKILKTSVKDAQTLPGQSVLSDQTQTMYWVMKLINDSTAVKVPVKKGIEKGDTIQILSPQFSNDTKILSGGNYGLSDTAAVIVSPGSNVAVSDSSKILQ
ncbi:MAG: efflux RND transporter periplasmic adaptor subunit [Bacteroidota bacterium]|nr:efflux RND transporter periplasmic adaptor subunit [Bacteroidota bacterium]